MKCLMCSATVRPLIKKGIKYCPKCFAIIGTTRKIPSVAAPSAFYYQCTKCEKPSTLLTKSNGKSFCCSCGAIDSMIMIKRPEHMYLYQGEESHSSDTQAYMLLGLKQKDQPKDKKGKYQPHLVLGSLIRAIARVREYGVRKYHGEDGWKQQTAKDYMDAIGRHYDECRNDPESRDEESGLLHIAQIATNAMFVIQMLKEKGIDLDTMKEPPSVKK